MSETRFTDQHEWIKTEGDIATVGITKFAAEQLGDVVYVELPKVGAKVSKGGQAGVVESVKSASELYSPVTGEVVEVNAELAKDPALVNQDPLGKAWFFKVKIANDSELSGLKDENAYDAYIKGL